MRRDTKAIEAAGRAAYEDFNSGLIGCCEDPWEKLSEDFRQRLSNADGAAIDCYLTHLAEHGDDDGRLIVREAATWLQMALNHDVLSSAPGAHQWKLVPVEADVKMVEAGSSRDVLSITFDDPRLEHIAAQISEDVYDEMLAAAPSITGEKE